MGVVGHGLCACSIRRLPISKGLPWEVWIERISSWLAARRGLGARFRSRVISLHRSPQSDEDRTPRWLAISDL